MFRVLLGSALLMLVGLFSMVLAVQIYLPFGLFGISVELLGIITGTTVLKYYMLSNGVG